jgi:hypothetical protein
VNFQRKKSKWRNRDNQESGKAESWKSTWRQKSRDTVPLMSCNNSSSLLSFVPRKNTYNLRTKETIGLFLIMRIATFHFSIYLHLSFCLSYLLPAVSLPLLLPRLPPSPRDPCRVAIFYAALREPTEKSRLEFGRYRKFFKLCSENLYFVFLIWIVT